MAAILAADMAGFSRLMEADEQRTVARQKTYFEEILNPSVQQAKGRIVKTTGDGFLAEFASVVDAVQCAVVMQTAMSQHEIPGQDQPLIQYRMAVNLGDLIIDGDEIYGDGVNIAARLEAFADPGGIVVSGTAFDHLKSNVDVGYEDLGERTLKNISVPVRLYRVVESSGFTGDAQRRAGKPRIWSPTAILAALFLAVGSWTWFQLDPASKHSAVTELQALPGIAVLPFENLSVDDEQSYFATGLTEELTARLAHFSNLRVIARNSASQFMDGQFDMRDISKALHARYLIEGSVRRDSTRVRVTARLIDGEAGDQLWTSTYDEELSAKAIFDIQEEIAAAVASNVGGLGGAVRKTAMIPLAERPDDIEAYDCVLLHYKFWDTFDHEVHARARECLESAVQRHPEFAFAWAELAYTYWTEEAYGVNPLPGSLTRAKQAAERAIELDPNMAEGYGALSQTYRSMRMADEALAAAERAFKVNPNNVGILGGSGCMLTFTGRLKRAEVFLDRALTLDPLPPWWIPYCKSIWHIQKDDPEAALAMLDKHSGPDIWLLSFARIVALIEADRVDDAKALYTRVLQSNPNLEASAKSYIEKNFWAQPEFEERLTSALQIASEVKT